MRTNLFSLLQTHEDFKESHVSAFVSDLTADDLCKEILPSSVDIVTMVFKILNSSSKS